MQPQMSMPQNQALMNALRARAATMSLQGAPGVSGAPNTIPVAQPAPAPTAGSARVMAPGAAGAPQGQPGSNPASAVMKAASQAQSPLVSDMETRNYAKMLVQKLLQHM